MIDVHPDPIALADPDGTLAHANPAWRRRFGSAGRIDAVCRDDALDRAIAAAMARQSGAECVTELVDGEGKACTIAWAVAAEWQGGAPRALCLTARDVSESLRLRQALQTTQASLDHAARVGAVGGWEVDLRDGRVSWSDQTRRIHEVDDAFLPTVPQAIDFYAPSARPEIEAAIRRAIDDRLPWDLELPLITATGRQIQVRAVGEALFEADRPIRLHGSFQDVTLRHRLEMQVSDNERFLGHLVDELPLHFAYLDAELRYVVVNRSLRQRLGSGGETDAGLQASAARLGIDPNDVGHWAIDACAGTPRTIEADDPGELAARRFKYRLVADVDPSGSARGYFLLGIDITERVQAEQALRELTTIFDNTPDFVVQTDSVGRILYMNPAARRSVGVDSGASLLGRHYAEFVSPASKNLFQHLVVPAVEMHGVWLGETRIRLVGRDEVPVSHMVIAHRNAAGRVERYSSVMRDISNAVRDQEEVQRQTEILRSVAEAIPSTVVVVDREGRYRFVNSAFESQCGMSREQIIGRRAADVLSEAEVARRRPYMVRALAGESVSFTLDYPSPSGTRYLALSCIPLCLQSGAVDGFVGVSQDITQQKREEDRLLRLAQRDPLTGLLNRAGFERGIESMIEQAEHAAGLAVLYIDLDDFKPVNDRHGHPAGDAVLQAFARRLGSLVRPGDLVARLGGDEFAVAVAGVSDAETVGRLAQQVLAAADVPVDYGAAQLVVRASVGAATTHERRPAWQELLAQADAELLRAKATGKGRYAVHPRAADAVPG